MHDTATLVYDIRPVSEVREEEGEVVLVLRGGAACRFRADHPDAGSFRIVARWSMESRRPVGFVADSNGTLIDLGHTTDTHVARFWDSPDPGRLMLGFWAYCSVCSLRRDHPDFERIHATLLEALRSNRRVWLANHTHRAEWEAPDGEVEAFVEILDVRLMDEVEGPLDGRGGG